GRGFSTPILLQGADGRPELVLNGPHGVWAYNPRTGEELWHCERHKGDDGARFGEPLPAYTADTLFIASGRPGPLLAVRRGGHGDLTPTNILWDVSRKGSRDVASPMLWGDDLYLADRNGVLTCYDTKTGKARFKERLGTKPFVASPVAVRGKLLYTLEDG